MVFAAYEKSRPGNNRSGFFFMWQLKLRAQFLDFFIKYPVIVAIIDRAIDQVDARRVEAMLK